MIVVPVLLLMLMMVIQAYLRIDAQRVAQAAAEEGAADARRIGGSSEQASRTAYEYADWLSEGSLTDVHVTVDLDAEKASVTVTGTAVSLIPGIDLSVTQTSTGPVEHFVETSGEFANSEVFEGGN
ncbi:hypothetical protein L0C25_04345 [Solicola gregarius]|uniref:TadE-like domain-containing protein n=2 Tax=Solicola gregarius TaxID=2908642 RepID=A0AA46YKZ1_9ACTN|nr:hypothetical protein L0C25_04345 [Solicola gregarius]